jgi:hypothetical protein
MCIFQCIVLCTKYMGELITNYLIMNNNNNTNILQKYTVKQIKNK